MLEQFSQLISKQIKLQHQSFRIFQRTSFMKGIENKEYRCASFTLDRTINRYHAKILIVNENSCQLGATEERTVVVNHKPIKCETNTKITYPLSQRKKGTNI